MARSEYFERFAKRIGFYSFSRWAKKQGFPIEFTLSIIRAVY